MRQESIRRRERWDQGLGFVFRCTGLLTITALGAILYMLLSHGLRFLMQENAGGFFTAWSWCPDEHTYGVWPLLISTFLVSFGALVIAGPLGILCAAYIAELAPPGLKNILKSITELLAAVPSVAIGFLGIVVVGPLIAGWLGIPNGLNALNGSILLAFMALPTIISISEDALMAVPSAHKEASYALGADRWHTLFKVTIPASSPGIIAAVMLGFGRALGETMTVLMATGNTSAIPSGFLDPVRTITATIAIEMGEVPFRSTHYYALLALATLLFLISIVVNLVGEFFAQRSRKFLS